MTSQSRAPRTRWVLRPFEPADRPALERMYAEFEPKRAAQGLPPGEPGRTREWLDRVLRHGHHILAIAGVRIIGHVMTVPVEPGTVELANFVHQAWRGLGLGTELCRAAVRAARGHGARRVWLSVDPSNRAAIRSYLRAGFRPLPSPGWGQAIEMAVDLHGKTAPDLSPAGAA